MSRYESKSRYRSDDEEKYSLRELKERARQEAVSEKRSEHRHHRREEDRQRGHRDDRRNIRRSRSGSRDRSHHHYRRDSQFHRRGNHHQDERNRDRPRNTHKDQFDQKTNEGQTEADKQPPVEIKPNFELTGALARDTNTFNGIVIKYNQPPEAKVPTKRWRLYPFKNDQPLDFIAIHRQSAYLIGRERKVADIPIDHPSCSKQHAVIQFRSIEYEREDGSTGRRTKPYIIDLESANGTFVNHQQIEARRYVELFEQDVLKFGFSSREYVLLHEQSQEGELDDDTKE